MRRLQLIVPFVFVASLFTLFSTGYLDRAFAVKEITRPKPISLRTLSVAQRNPVLEPLDSKIRELSRDRQYLTEQGWTAGEDGHAKLQEELDSIEDELGRTRYRRNTLQAAFEGQYYPDPFCGSGGLTHISLMDRIRLILGIPSIHDQSIGLISSLDTF